MALIITGYCMAKVTFLADEKSEKLIKKLIVSENSCYVTGDFQRAEHCAATGTLALLAKARTSRILSILGKVPRIMSAAL